MQQLMFKLDQNPKGRGLRCDGDGLFLGRDALLQKDDEGNFKARPDSELQNTLSRIYGGETAWDSQIRSVKLVANALNKRDMARAMMTAVLMRLPDPGTPRMADTEGAFAKAGYDPEEPRDERGRWTDGSGENATRDTMHRDPRIQLADAGMSDAANDPVAEAAARAAAAQHALNSAGARGQSGGTSKQENLWQTLRAKLPAEAQSLLSAIVRAQTDEGEAILTAATAESKAITDTARAYAKYRAQPWIGPDGRPMEIYSFPMVSGSVPVFNPGPNLFAPNAPIKRPATNADWIDPLINLASVGAMVVGPAARLLGPAAELSGSIADASNGLRLSELSVDGAEHAEGSFSISDWPGYPSNLSRPAGPFRLLNGDEYDAARAAANNANRALREADPAAYAGKQIHEIQPIKFGGSPTDPTNKIALTPAQHAAATTWWNRLLRNLSNGWPK
jgi:hypothetical protein